jgi:acyl-CoA thioesterase FadM
LGFTIAPRQFEAGHPKVGWPRVHASCDYHQPLRFEDLVEIHLLIAEKKSKAITYQFRFRKLGDGDGKEVARGKLTVVCVGYDEASGAMKATSIPPEIAGRIEAAPAELFA